MSAVEARADVLPSRLEVRLWAKAAVGTWVYSPSIIDASAV